MGINCLKHRVRKEKKTLWKYRLSTGNCTKTAVITHLFQKVYSASQPCLHLLHLLLCLLPVLHLSITTLGQAFNCLTERQKHRHKSQSISTWKTFQVPVDYASSTFSVPAYHFKVKYKHLHAMQKFGCCLWVPHTSPGTVHKEAF